VRAGKVVRDPAPAGKSDDVGKTAGLLIKIPLIHFSENRSILESSPSSFLGFQCKPIYVTD
jgi:hypothetical protein